MIYGNSVRNAQGEALSSVNDTYQVALTGGIGGSNSMSSTGHRIRAAAVAARAELLKLASAKLGVAGLEPDGRARASSPAAARPSPTASSSAGSSSTSR